MKIRDLCDESGRLVRFEISNTFLSRYAARRIIRSIPGVRFLKEPTFLGILHIDGGEDEFIKFELGGDVFHVFEPFADSHAYLIGTDKQKSTEGIAQIRAAFESARPSIGRIGGFALFVAVTLYLLFSVLS